MNPVSSSQELPLQRSQSDSHLAQNRDRPCQKNRSFPSLRANKEVDQQFASISFSWKTEPYGLDSRVVKVSQRLLRSSQFVEPSSYPPDMTQSFSHLLKALSRVSVPAISNPSSLEEYFDSWVLDGNVSWRLQEFSRSIPKGDIHSHFTGAIPPESLLRAAGKYGLVFDLEESVALSLKEIFDGRYQFAHPSQEGVAHGRNSEELLAIFASRQSVWKEFMRVDPRLSRQLCASQGEYTSLGIEQLYRNFISRVNDLGILWDVESGSFVRSSVVFEGKYVLFTRMSQVQKETFKQECTVSSEQESGRTNYKKFHTAVFRSIESITERLALPRLLEPYVKNQLSDKVLFSTPSKGMEIRVNEFGEKFSETQLQTLRDFCPRYDLENVEASEEVMAVVEGFLNCRIEDEVDIRSYVEKSVLYWKEYVLEGFESNEAPEHREYASKLLYFSKLKEEMASNFIAMEEGERVESPVPYWNKKTALFFNVDLCRQQDLSLFILDLEIAVRMIEALPEYVTGIVVSGKEDDVYAKEDRHLQLALLKAYIDRSKKNLRPLHVSIHAGEMDLHNNGEVQELKTVIFDAIATGAERIGHGLTLQQLDIEQKNQLEQLLDERKICIETCLSSNINLGFAEKKGHPFPAYLSMMRKLSGAGLTFNTDDLAVFMTSLSQELFKAISEYQVPYQDLLRMLRDSIRWSFAPGEEIYEELGYELKPCFVGCQELDWQPSTEAQRILLSSTRACLAVQFERLFSELEKEYLGESKTDTTTSSESELSEDV